MADIHIIKWSLQTQNQFFDINANHENALEIPEQELCIFFLEIHGGTRPKLLLGDFEINLNLVEVDGVVSKYETERIKCFQNFIGLTQAELYFENPHKEFKSVAINVFARKATYERALSFLKLLKDKSDISSVCFSVTQLNSDSNSNSKNLSAMLNAGIKALDYFQEQRSRFSQYPCYNTKTRTKVEKYSHSTHLDERSISYLCTHPESLYLSYVNERDVIIGSRNLKINQVETTEHYKDTNIIENQIILSFLKLFLRYLKSVSSKLKKSRVADSELITFDGKDYLSIDKLLLDSGLIVTLHKERIENAIHNCIRCIQFIDKHIPCKIGVSSLAPIPTQQVLARTHYLNLYELIKKFHDVGEPQWRGQFEFFGLRNLYKIYEFVCLVNLIDAIKSNGFTLQDSNFVDRNGETAEIRPINEPCNYYLFENGGKKLSLMYEPKALQARYYQKSIKPGTIIDLVHRSKKTWTPDFVLSIQEKNNIQVHIFDSKYSGLQNVLEYHIEHCALKYTTKLMVSNEEGSLQKVDSMTLLFSGESDGYRSYYTSPFGLYNEGKINYNAVKPIIGMFSHNENNATFLPKLLKDLLT